MKAGQDVSIEIPYSGHPKPTAVWSKNKSKLNDQVITSQTSSMCKINLKKVRGREVWVEGEEGKFGWRGRKGVGRNNWELERHTQIQTHTYTQTRTHTHTNTHTHTHKHTQTNTQVKRSDAGEYDVALKNKAGKIDVPITLKVIGGFLLHSSALIN